MSDDDPIESDDPLDAVEAAAFERVSQIRTEIASLRRRHAHCVELLRMWESHLRCIKDGRAHRDAARVAAVADDVPTQQMVA